MQQGVYILLCLCHLFLTCTHITESFMVTITASKIISTKDDLCLTSSPVFSSAEDKDVQNVFPGGLQCSFQCRTSKYFRCQSSLKWEDEESKLLRGGGCLQTNQSF